MADKNIPAPEHDPRQDGKPHGNGNEKKPRKEKKRRRRPGLVLFLILLLVILVALIWFFRDGFGLGGGNGTQSGTNNNSEGVSNTVTSDTSESAPDKSLEITEIRIVENDIYIGSEKCVDENDLKDKLTALGKDKKYKVVHDTAIKETYDKVKTVLLELKDSLGLEINFNE